MKLLSIGNSFSQDAQKWLQPIAESTGTDLLAVNLYIGGCSLAMHWENWKSGEALYDYEVGGIPKQKISLQEALQKESWDIITVQQVSDDSGIPESFEPFLTDLCRVVRQACPRARLYLHETWSYEHGASHPAFRKFGSDPRRMFLAIADSYEKASARVSAPVIPTGHVIQALREHVPAFDYPAGGLSLNRDGFHLSYDYGRYAAALTWYGFLLEKDVRSVTFCPPGTDPSVLHAIRQMVFQILSESAN